MTDMGFGRIVILREVWKEVLERENIWLDINLKILAFVHTSLILSEGHH